ncbi:PLP-dependent cysteine synthase family protein [Microbacterium panaciterrae]
MFARSQNLVLMIWVAVDQDFFERERTPTRLPKEVRSYMSSPVQSAPIETGFPARRADRQWVREALEQLEAETCRSGWTPLLPLRLRSIADVDIYLKDESLHPTGSLKHRLARSLFFYALCNGDIGPRTTIVEASSGSTAVSEAYFAQILGLDFIAVIPAATSREKVALIEQHGGRVHAVDHPSNVVPMARRLAKDSNGYFMDQFTYASQATNWRQDNIASELLTQMQHERYPKPQWIVVGAGTGGTSTTFARFARYVGLSTRIAVADPEGSAFYEGWRHRDRAAVTPIPSRIEGIGRPQVEPSFYPNLVDEVIPVPDAASIAAMRWTSELLGRRVGASTGTNMWVTLQLALRAETSRRMGSVVSLICDSGDRYESTYYNDAWLFEQGIDISPFVDALSDFNRTGAVPFANGAG